ncbi:MAG: TolC family protein, partial [Cyanobacteria bacterium J083]
MLVIRHFIATSCGVLIALVYGGNAIADQSFSFEQSTSNSSLKLKKQAKFLAQEESDNIDEKIQPSANPLFFPTQPEEVEIDLTQPITLEDAIRLALRNNNDIAQARLNLERSLASLKQAKAALYPTLSTQLEFNYTESPNLERTVKIDSEEGGSIDVLRQNRDLAKLAGDQAAVDDLNEQIERAIDTDTISIDGDITLNYDVYTGGGRSATIRQAEKQVEFNRLDLERITAQVRFEAVSNYYQLQNNDAEVEIAQAAIEDAKQTLRDAQLLERAGLGTRFDVLRAEVELANANQSLILA